MADKEAWERFEFLANWYGDKFGDSPSVMNTGLDIREGSYDHLELLEQSYKDKKRLMSRLMKQNYIKNG